MMAQPLSQAAQRFLPHSPEERVAVLLPHQAQLLASNKPKSAFVSGWGGGKTRGEVWNALRLGCRNPGLPGLFVAPTYSLIEDSILREFEALFVELGMKEGEDFDMRRRAPPSIKVRLNDVEFEILFRSTDNPASLIALTMAWAIIDEAAFIRDEMIDATCARVRHPHTRFSHISLSSTPEAMTGRFFEWAENPGDDIDVIRARTTDNYLLPKGFVENNLAHLSEQDRERYINGEFITPGGRVYTCYAPETHEVKCEDPGDGQPVMTCDFGYGCMPWIYGTVRGGQHVHYFGEQVLEGDNPYDAIVQARSHWKRFFKRYHGVDLSLEEAAANVDVYADPAGGKEYGKSDIRLLEEHGFRVHHRRRHPPVRDRVNALQMKLHRREVLVDPEGCPYLSKCFRHHAYDPRTGFPKKHRAREGKKGLDHGVDAAGYHVEYEWPAGGRSGRFLNR